MNRSSIVAVLGLAGAGAVYIFLSNRDTTPVGMTAREFIGGESLGKKDDKSYKIDLILGTFRASESSLSISSEDKENPLLIVYEDGTPIDARIVDINNWMVGDGATNEDRIRVAEKYIALKKELGLDTEKDEAKIQEIERPVEEPVLNNAQTQNAEFMMLGHVGLNALQSNHSW
jgi:hypothetical protein